MLVTVWFLPGDVPLFKDSSSRKHSLYLHNTLHDRMSMTSGVPVWTMSPHTSSQPDEGEGAALSRQILSIRRLRPRQPAQTLAQPQLRQIQIPQPLVRSQAQTLGESARVSFPLKWFDLIRHWFHICEKGNVRISSFVSSDLVGGFMEEDGAGAGRKKGTTSL